MIIKATKQEYKSVIFSGCMIETSGVSICNLEDVLSTRVGVPRAKYQVWSDGHRFHQLYFSIDEAIEKFIELKNRR
tara:strand:+ start:8311 stop:8538 length:228 start_codon:yes stop_codon:yes gene_type:complete